MKLHQNVQDVCALKRQQENKQTTSSCEEQEKIDKVNFNLISLFGLGLSIFSFVANILVPITAHEQQQQPIHPPVPKYQPLKEQLAAKDVELDDLRRQLQEEVTFCLA
jgi:hypothetical protein